MRVTRYLWLIPLVLQAAGAAVAVEPSVTRIALNGQTRIYRTYGWAAEPEVFAPLLRELQASGLTSEWQPGQEQVTLRYRETVVQWRVARSSDVVHVASRRAGTASLPEALEIDGTLYLPIRATAALMGGSVTWNASQRTLAARVGGPAVASSPASRRQVAGSRLQGAGVQDATPQPANLQPETAGEGATVTRLQWSETAGGLALDVEATAPVRAAVLQLQNPTRLVIDFTPATFGLDAVPAPRGAVRSVRVGEFQAGTARVVLELSGARLTGTGLPATPQSRFSIRLTGAAAIAAAPRTSSAKGAAIHRTRRLASRGGFAVRDVEGLKAALAGEGELRGKVICVDAGHGGHDPGAQGVTGLFEKDLTLQMALEAARALEEAGATVIMTRSDDTFISLDGRYDLANDRGVDLFISIHCNSMQRQNSASGTQTYYCNDFSRRLAQSLHPQIVGAMAGRDGGIHCRRFAVVRHTTMPAVLLEVGYINHSGDEQKLADPEYQHAVAEGIRDGVIRYFNG